MFQLIFFSPGAESVSWEHIEFERIYGNFS